MCNLRWNLVAWKKKGRPPHLKKTWAVTGFYRDESLKISWWELCKKLPSKRIEILEIVQTRRQLVKFFPTSKDSQFFIVTDSLYFNKNVRSVKVQSVKDSVKTNFNQRYFVNFMTSVASMISTASFHQKFY